MQISYFQTSSSSETFNTESTWSKDLAYGFFYFWDHVRAMFGPCRDHVWPSFTYRPARALKLSTLYLHGLRHISLGFLFFGTMLGPCWDHVWPSFTSRPARSLKFSRLSQHGLRPMPTECLLFRTTSGPCLDHVGALGPAIDLWSCFNKKG